MTVVLVWQPVLPRPVRGNTFFLFDSAVKLSGEEAAGIGWEATVPVTTGSATSLATAEGDGRDLDVVAAVVRVGVFAPIGELLDCRLFRWSMRRWGRRKVCLTVSPSGPGRQTGSEEEEVVQLVAAVETAPALIAAAFGFWRGVGEEGSLWDVACCPGGEIWEMLERRIRWAGFRAREALGARLVGVDGGVVLIVVPEEGFLDRCAVAIHCMVQVVDVVVAGNVVGVVVDAHICVLPPRIIGIGRRFLVGKGC